MEELKPCPFCGSHPLIEVGLNTAYVYCEKCKSRTREYEDMDPEFAVGGSHTNYVMDYRMTRVGKSAAEQAVEAWNRRTNDGTD